MTNGKGDPWEKFSWGEKVSLCEQVRASENYLLHVYLLVFMAIQAVLFALFISFRDEPGAYLFAIPGIGFAILWAFVTESRGNDVDRWEELLASLWEKSSQSEPAIFELTTRYKGAVDRRRFRKEHRWKKFCGWGSVKDRFESARWVFVTLLPLILALLWMVLMCWCFLN